MTARALALAAAVWLLAPAPVRAGYSFDLDFTQPGAVLPSAAGQGLSYFGNTPETSAYKIQNNLLHLETVGNAIAYYGNQANPYDHTLPARFEARLRVTAASGFYGALFGFVDNTFAAQFNITPTGWGVLPFGAGQTGSFDGTAFHDYDFRVAANTGAYEFRIDAVLVSSGTLAPGGGQEVYFGDGASIGSTTADFAYVRYTNLGPAAVPEPASAGLLAAGLGVAGVVRRLRRREEAK